MRFFVLLLLLSLGLPVHAAHDYELVKVVMLMRHGVRAPGQSPQTLAAMTERDWPAWPVAPGELTPHGRQDMVLLGEYLASRYRAEGLLSDTTCQAVDRILVWSDNIDQRTRLSGQALLDGMVPGCHAKVQYKEPVTQPDLMFHPVQNRVCALDATAVQQSTSPRLTLAEMARQAGLRINLMHLGHLLHPGWDNEQLQQWSSPALQVSTGQDGHDLKLGAPYGEAAAVSEIIALEYAEGLPTGQVAWGQVASLEDLAPIMTLHNLKLSAVEQTPYIASRNGSMLAQRILTELQTPAATSHQVVVLVGHDTNVANLAGMLGLHWHDVAQPDDIGPGTVLAFELLKNRRNGDERVRIRLIRQTADQLRAATLLDASHPPLVVTLPLPDCAGQSVDLCSLQAFAGLLAQRMVPQCLGHLNGV